MVSDPAAAAVDPAGISLAMVAPSMFGFVFAGAAEQSRGSRGLGQGRLSVAAVAFSLSGRRLRFFSNSALKVSFLHVSLGLLAGRPFNEGGLRM